VPRFKRRIARGAFVSGRAVNEGKGKGRTLKKRAITGFGSRSMGGALGEMPILSRSILSRRKKERN